MITYEMVRTKAEAAHRAAGELAVTSHAEYAGDPGAVRAGRRTGCRRDRLREWRKHLQ